MRRPRLIDEPSMRPAGDSPHLRDYVRMFRRRWLWVAGGALLGLAAGFAATTLVDPSYQAQATVLVEPVSQDTSVTDVNLDTEAQLVTSFEVASLAAETLGVDDPRALLPDVEVSIPPNSQLLVISYEGSTADAAREGADAFAAAYLDNRASQTAEANQKEAETRKATVDELTTQLRDLATQAESLSRGSGDRVYVDKQIELVTAQIAREEQSIAELGDVDLNGGRVVSAAATPTSTSGPGRILYLMSGLMLGVLGGLAAGAVRERVDPVVRDAAQLTQVTGGPVVEVPMAGELVSPSTGWTDYLRSLTRHIDQHPSLVLIAGEEPEVVRAISRSLAEQVSRSGHAAAFIDVSTSAAQGTPGLTDLLSGSSDAVGRWDGVGVLVIGPGRDPDRLVDLAFDGVATGLRTLPVDQVVVCGVEPSSATAHAMSQDLDACFYVVVVGVSRFDRVARALSVLQPYRRRGAGGVLVVDQGWLRRRVTSDAAPKSEPEVAAQQGPSS